MTIKLTDGQETESLDCNYKPVYSYVLKDDKELVDGIELLSDESLLKIDIAEVTLVGQQFTVIAQA